MAILQIVYSASLRLAFLFSIWNGHQNMLVSERDEILANLTRATEGTYKSSRDYENSTEKMVFACGEYTVEVLFIKSSSWLSWLNRCMSV